MDSMIQSYQNTAYSMDMQVESLPQYKIETHQHPAYAMHIPPPQQHSELKVESFPPYIKPDTHHSTTYPMEMQHMNVQTPQPQPAVTHLEPQQSIPIEDEKKAEPDDPLTAMIYNFIKSENEAKTKEAEERTNKTSSPYDSDDAPLSPVVKAKRVVRKMRRKMVHECTVCQKTFNRSAALTQHLRVHSGEKPLKCEFCEKAFNTSSSLSRHRKIHTDTRIHMCEVCSKKFSTPVDLKKHLRTHTGEKPYKCEVCGKAFAQFGNLNMHLRSHTGERPHPCDICPKRFSSPYKMQLHRRIHTGEKNYKCEICLKAFTQNTHLVQHRKTHIAKEFRGYKSYHNM